MCCRGDPANLAILEEVLSYDHNIIGLDDSLIITPDTSKVVPLLRKKMRVMSDDEMVGIYPALKNLDNAAPRWYYQQILKFCAIDYLQRYRILIQDSDSFVRVSYDPFQDNKLNFISHKDKTWHIFGQADFYAMLMNRYPCVDDDCTSEFCPYTLDVWDSFKDRIELIHKKDWLVALVDLLNETWTVFREGLHEYYLLINHAVHQRSEHRMIPMSCFNPAYPCISAVKQEFDRIAYMPTIGKRDGRHS